MLPTGALLRFRPPPLIYDVAADHVNAIRIKRDGPGVSRFIPFFRIYERGVRESKLMKRLTKVRKFGHEGALEMFIAAPHEFGE
jgi:hypothetical protein